VDVSKDQGARIASDHDLNQLAAFVEHRLDDGERATVVQHLATCRECRQIVAGLAARPFTNRRALRTAVWLPIAASLALVIGAGWFARDRFGAPPPTEPPIVAPTPDPTTPTPTPPVVAPTPKPAPPPVDPGTTRRGSEREIAGRRFRLEAGTWIDVGYDPFALLPAVDVRTVAERDTLLVRVPDLKPYLALGSKLTVVHAGTVYRFDLPR